MAHRGVPATSSAAGEVNEPACKPWETACESAGSPAPRNKWDGLTTVGPPFTSAEVGWAPGTAGPQERVCTLSSPPSPRLRDWPLYGSPAGSSLAFESETSVLRDILSSVFGLISQNSQLLSLAVSQQAGLRGPWGVGGHSLFLSPVLAPCPVPTPAS